MNTITITMEATKENIEKLLSLFPETQTAAAPTEPIAEPAKPKAKKKAPEPVDEAAEILSKVAPESEKIQTPDEPIPEETISKTDIRAVALKLSKAGKQKELADIFAKFGCKKLSDFDNRTEDYPALMKELVSVNG